MDKIILWESNGEIIRDCQIAIALALKELGLKATVTVNAEPPLISRNQLWDRLPVLEIHGTYWSLYPGKPFTKEQLVKLFWKALISAQHT